MNLNDGGGGERLRKGESLSKLNLREYVDQNLVEIMTSVVVDGTFQEFFKVLIMLVLHRDSRHIEF